MTSGRDIPLTGRWVADAIAGSIVSGDRGRQFAGVSIDSRTVGRDELFIGIRGERFDGSEFAPMAIAAGAAGLVLPRGRGGALSGDAAPIVIEVDDTTAALQALARTVRLESRAKVVAITGSAGKTTTKEVTAEFLGARYRVIRNHGNLNNHIGLPLSLIELRHRPEIAVVELGMNHAGEISTLVDIAVPEVRVWTNVGEAHVGFFGSVDAIADAKAEILERATPETLLVANADDERIMTRAIRFGGRLVTFGIEHPATVHASAIVDRGIEGTTARVSTPRGDLEVTTPLVGRTNLENVLAATAVGVEFGVPLEAIAERARRLRPATHRGQVVRLGRDVILIDDSYNANPTATRRALEVLGRETRARRRIAVVGEMLELGDRSAALHAEVGRAVARTNIDLLVAVGGTPVRALAEAAAAAGMAPDRVHYAATSGEAADIVARMVEPGDVLLVKGSRGVRTDLVVERLTSELA